ncbi:MAG: Crp/Fnr family transcriptional regulator [Vicinamibacterales bacterium]
MARVDTYRKNRLVFRAGERSTHVYVLESGVVKVFEMSDLGRDTILWFCLPGEIFGLAEAVAGGWRGVSAQACEQSTLLSVPGDQFRQYLATHPQASMLCLQALSARLRGLGHVLVNFVSDDVHTRIGKLLLRLGARYGSRVGTEIILQIPLTHQAISDMVGAARPTVSSALGDFKRKGVLSIDSHRIRIESEELLNEIRNG